MTHWPLHPQPYIEETLETYVRRLARCYGASYPQFCLRALGIPITDSRARRFKNPTAELLQRLSDGTGVPIERLEKMTWEHVWAQLLEDLNQYVATPEGQAYVQQISNL